MKCLLLLLLLTLPALSSAKQPITRITLHNKHFTSPLTISATDIVSRFSVWNGPSVKQFDGQGNLKPPQHLDPNARTGRFVDWPRDIVKQPPELKDVYEVVLQLGKDSLNRDYRFTYGLAPSTNQGYIYLPHDNQAVIWHGVEGNWFYATSDWDEVMVPALSSHRSGG